MMAEGSGPHATAIAIHAGPVQGFTYLGQVIYNIAAYFSVHQVFGM